MVSNSIPRDVMDRILDMPKRSYTSRPRSRYSHLYRLNSLHIYVRLTGPKFFILLALTELSDLRYPFSKIDSLGFQ